MSNQQRKKRDNFQFVLSGKQRESSRKIYCGSCTSGSLLRLKFGGKYYRPILDKASSLYCGVSGAGDRVPHSPLYAESALSGRNAEFLGYNTRKVLFMQVIRSRNRNPCLFFTLGSLLQFFRPDNFLITALPGRRTSQS